MPGLLDSDQPRSAEFDDLYIFPPLLEACCRVIGRPFKLSSLLGRTLRPRSPAQELRVDVRRNSADWPLLSRAEECTDSFRMKKARARTPGQED